MGSDSVKQILAFFKDLPFLSFASSGKSAGEEDFIFRLH